MALQSVTQKTYLQLLVKAMDEAGVQQRTPTTIDDTNGLVPDFKRWINDEWEEIQDDREWDWRKTTTEVVLADTMNEYDPETLLDAESLVLMMDEQGIGFLLLRELDTSTTTVSDVVWSSVSGNNITVAGTSLPALLVGEHFVVTDAADSSNDGTYRVTTVTTSEAEYDVIKVGVGLTAPANDASDTATFEYATGEGSQSDEDQTKLRFVGWREWRGFNERLVSKDEGQPTKFTVDQDGKLLFDRPCDKFYGIDFDYFDEVQEMTADSDKPTIPAKYQDIIAWGAVLRYGGFDETDKVIARAGRRHRQIKKKMDEQELPPMRLAPRPLYNDYD